MAQKYSELAKSRKAALKESQDSSSSKLIIVVALVILSIGGFIWLIGNGKSNEEDYQEEEDTQEGAEEEAILEDNEEEMDVSDVAEEDIEEVDVSDKESDSTAEDAPTDSDFSQEDQTVGEESVSGVKLAEIEQLGYEGFFRIVFVIEDGGSLPYTQATLYTSSNMISVKMRGIDEDTSGIKTGNVSEITGSVVSTIFHEVTGEENLNWYKIGIKAETEFYLHTIEGTSKIVLDIKEQDVENGDGQEFVFSQESQSIEGDASGSVITISGLSHSGQSDVYRIILRLGTIGTGTIPNATSKIVDYEGGKAIKLVVENIYNDFPSSIDYDESYANTAVRGVKCTYASNVSTYYIRIGSVRDYKLYYMNAPTQLIVDVKM